MVQDGPKITIVDTMTNKNNGDSNHRLERVIELLKFALSVDDEEIIKSTVESVIEILEEEIAK
jgi:hypothetical protein